MRRTAGVDRASAERAGSPSGGDDGLRAGRERARHRRGQPHEEDLLGLGLLDGQVHQLLLGGLDRDLDLDLGDREDLDDDPLVLAVPRQRDRAGAELLLDRLLEGVVVDQVDRGHGGDRGAGVLGGDQLVEQLRDPLPEDLHLLLLQGHRGELGTGSGLEEERPRAGLADGPGHEALGRVEAVDDGHGDDSRRWWKHPGSRDPRPHPRPRRRTASGAAAAWWPGAPRTRSGSSWSPRTPAAGCSAPPRGWPGRP